VRALSDGSRNRRRKSRGNLAPRRNPDAELSGDVVAAARATRSPDPTLFVMPRRQQLEVCLRDPDGVLIDLIDRPPAMKDRTASVGS
jgi:hypothetical protein